MSACTCGRSPTDNCVGWHNLTEDKYLEKKAAHEARMDLSRFRAAPSARLSHLAFESDGAFPTQC